jgi:hypothetical protein
MNINVVGTFTMKDGVALVIHGTRVIYEGPVSGCFKPAADHANSFILMSLASKQKLDAKIAEDTKGAPLAKPQA